MTDVKNILPIFRQKLRYITQSEQQSEAEKKAASFYLKTLEPFDYKCLIKQGGFDRGVGGTGDNIIIMPLVERNSDGTVITENDRLKITHCVFNDFQSYLNYIDRHKHVRHETACWMSLPVNVDGIPRQCYESIWFRHLGIKRDY